MSKTIAIVPAAGSGERMGLPQSKLLCKISGKSIIFRTLSAFIESGFFDRILVPCRDSDRSVFATVLGELASKIEFLQGGMTRQESVFKALKRIQESEDSPENSLVCIHDAARCFVSKELIQKSLEAARIHKAITVAIPCVDTVYNFDDSGKIATPLLERSKLRSIQTPQVFNFELLFRAHQQACTQSSDDAGLVAAIYPVKVVEGEISNFKITTVEDLRRAVDACTVEGPV